jgi:hypothetical protein
VKFLNFHDFSFTFAFNCSLKRNLNFEIEGSLY